MQNTDIRWLDIRNQPQKDDSDFAFERRRLHQAEAMLTSEISDELLLNLHLFAMDFEMENACYAVLKRQTEDLLFERLADGNERAVAPYDFIGAERCNHDQALDAAVSGALSNRELLSLFLSAECTRFMDNEGPTWQAVFDLTRLQILRRMQCARAGKVAFGSSIPDDATIGSANLPAKECAS